MKNKNLTENNIDYLLFCIHVILLHIVLSGVYLRRNIPVTDGKEVILTADKICSGDLMYCWEK
jgi:hypothetical protein